MASLIFKDAEVAKAAIMASQQKEIAKLYEDWADEIGERAKYYSHKSTASAPVSERYYRELQKQLRQTSQEVSNEVYKKIKSNIYTVADAVVSDNVKWLESFGFSSDGLNAAFSYVPHEIVQNLITGQIYDSGWSLSSRIWGDNEQTLKDIYQVMAKGLAENKPIYEIAKDLESYVRPSAKLPWNLRMADGKKIYKKQVDYNAQRLARTLVQHGYQQSFIATTQKNPFITEYVWRSNGSRVCELCLARDGVHYKKTELPMDHPNGMCTMEPVVVDDMVDKLSDWANSPDGTYPDIDEFAKQFGYESSIKESVKSNQPANTHYIAQGKDISATWQRRPDKFDFEIEDVINAQGFDGKPRVVSAEEFDEYVKQANDGVGFIAQRTYSAPSQEILDKYRDQLYNGKWYVDCSTGGAQHGQGMYCAGNYEGKLTEAIKQEMKDYQNQNLTYSGEKSVHAVETMTLDKSAKIINQKDLVIEWAKEYWPSKVDWWTQTGGPDNIQDAAIEVAKNIRAQELVKDGLAKNNFKATKMLNNETKGLNYIEERNYWLQKAEKAGILTDNGSYATLKGYDAIRTNHGTSGADTIILNRTKVIFKGE